MLTTNNIPIVKFSSFEKPKHKLEVREEEKHLWPLFHPHHYMTANDPLMDSLPRSSKFFTFYWVQDGVETLVGCLGVINQIGKFPARRITRLVVLPEFQGLGFSKLMLNSISEMYLKLDIKMYIVTFHPRLGGFLGASNAWAESFNNMKEFKLTVDESRPMANTLRDGIAMYRYNYIGDSGYSLKYHPIDLYTKQKQLDSMEPEDKGYNDLRLELNRLNKLKHPIYNEQKPPSLRVDDETHLKSKEEHARDRKSVV